MSIIKEAAYKYTFFGLSFSSHVCLPGVPPGRITTDKCDITLHLGDSPEEEEETSEELVYVSSAIDDKGEPALRIWKVEDGAFLRLAYSDGTQFWLDQTLENIWATWPHHLQLDDATPYLLGPVLGLFLRFRGVVSLHASAVAFGDYSVAFVGWAGAGKSTTAAAFARQGNKILSDDIVALEERGRGFYVLPAYPYLCLWPDSVKALYGSPEALPRFVPDWEKRRLALSEDARFENRALPLRAVYILGERRPDPAPYVEEIAPQDALISLVAETYANKLLDRELRAREFEFLGKLVTRILIRRVHAHEDPSKLGNLCRIIHEDCAAAERLTAAQR